MTTTNGIARFTKDEAKQETEKTRRMTHGLAAQLHRLKTHDAHTVLGYSTWKEYIEKEFEITARYARYLTDFFTVVQEVAERTGVENPPLVEKDLRGAKPEDVDTIVNDVNDAAAKGEDARAAAEQGEQGVRREEGRGAQVPQAPDPGRWPGHENQARGAERVG